MERVIDRIEETLHNLHHHSNNNYQQQNLPPNSGTTSSRSSQSYNSRSRGYSNPNTPSFSIDSSSTQLRQPPPPPPLITDEFVHTSNETIQQILKPIREAFEQLDAEELLNLTRCHRNEDGATLRQGVQIQPIHEIIEPSRDGMRYIHIRDIQQRYSMGIFVFPPNATIPLHDHPGMVVLSRLLYGELKVKSFDILEEKECTPNGDRCAGGEHSGGSSSGSSGVKYVFAKLFNKFVSATTTTNTTTKHENDGSIRALENEMTTMTAPDVTTLFPREGNIHEFTAGKHGAAVLDILLPPYEDEDDRGCTFYRVERDDDNAQQQQQAQQEQSTTTTESLPSLCWLVPREQPADFSCVTGYYEDFDKYDYDDTNL